MPEKIVGSAIRAIAELIVGLVSDPSTNFALDYRRKSMKISGHAMNAIALILVMGAYVFLLLFSVVIPYFLSKYFFFLFYLMFLIILNEFFYRHIDLIPMLINYIFRDPKVEKTIDQILFIHK